MLNSIETLEELVSEIEEQIDVAKRVKLYSDNWTKHTFQPSQASI